MQTHVFDDFDAFSVSVQGIDSRMLLRNQKRRKWTVTSVDLQGVEVQVGRLGSGNIAEGNLRPDGYMFYLPLTPSVEYVSCGESMRKSTFAVMAPGSEFCFSTKEAHDWCVAFIPLSLLPGGPDSTALRTGPFPASCRVSSAYPELAARFRSVIGDVVMAASGSPGFEVSAAALRASRELVNVTARIQCGEVPSQNSREGRPRIPRDEIIRRAGSWLEEHEDRSFGVSELAAAAGVSERTLRTTFGAYYGASPVRYLQLRQLNRVRRALQDADPEETSVSDVLVTSGVWQFSRFARRYRETFSELPSQTLARNRSR